MSVSMSHEAFDRALDDIARNLDRGEHRAMKPDTYRIDRVAPPGITETPVPGEHRLNETMAIRRYYELSDRLSPEESLLLIRESDNASVAIRPPQEVGECWRIVDY